MTGGKQREVVSRPELMRMAVRIVTALFSGNEISQDRIPEIINDVFECLGRLARGEAEDAKPTPKPAVPVRRSVMPDYLVCLEDGRKLKMLKRHLRTAYGMTPEQYRSRWNLPSSYPMVAPNYARHRSEFAKKIGLGRKGT